MLILFNFKIPNYIIIHHGVYHLSQVNMVHQAHFMLGGSGADFVYLIIPSEAVKKVKSF